MTNLTLKENTVKVYGSLDPESGTLSDEVAGACTEVKKDENGTWNFALDHDVLKLDQNGANKTFYLSYEATVDTNIAETNKASNAATLTYRNSSVQEQTSTTSEKKTNLYSFSFELRKIDMQGNSLQNAEFKIYKGDSNTPMKFVIEDGYYRPASENENDATDVLKANQTTNFSLTNQNAFVIHSLDQAGTYYLEESTTPGGYYAPSGKFNIEMKSLKNGDEHSGNLAENSSFSSVETADEQLVGTVTPTQNQLIATLKNSTTPSLPTTGGMGTILLTVAGVVLMIAAGTFFVLRRRKSQR